MALLGTALLGHVGWRRRSSSSDPSASARSARTASRAGSPPARRPRRPGRSCTSSSRSPRNAIATGRLGPLVLYALLPFLVLLLVRVGRFAGTAGRRTADRCSASRSAPPWRPRGTRRLRSPPSSSRSRSSSRRSSPAAWSPALRAFGASLVGVAGAAAAARAVDRDDRRSRDDLAALGIAFQLAARSDDVLRFHTGSGRCRVPRHGVSGRRARRVVRRTGPPARVGRRARCGSSSRVTRWCSSRRARAAHAGGGPGSRPRHRRRRGGLGGGDRGRCRDERAAHDLGLARERSRAERWRRRGADRSSVGGRRVLVGVAIAGVVVGGFGLAADTIGGRWHAPDGSWSERPRVHEGLQRSRATSGSSGSGTRTSCHSTRSSSTAEVSWVLTRNGAGDARELWRAPKTDADQVIAARHRRRAPRRTNRLGRLLAPAGVRYVVVAVAQRPRR